MQKHQQNLVICFVVIITLIILTSCGPVSEMTNKPIPSHTASPIVSGEQMIVYTAAGLSNGTSSTAVLARRASDGSPLWRFQISGPISTSVSDPVVVNHGIVYIAVAASYADYTNGKIKSMGDWLYAVRASDGTQLWQYQADMDISSITVTDGTVYVISNALVSLAALRADDGHLLWKQRTDTSTNMEITGLVIDGGIVYISTGEGGLKFPANGSVYALHANDGSPLWQSQLGKYNFFSLQVVNGIVYVGASDKYWFDGHPQPFNVSLYAVRASDGGLLWHSEVWSSEMVLHYQESQGVVYVIVSGSGSSSASTVTALQVTQGTSLWQSQINILPTGVKVAGGVVYAYEDGGRLDALRASDGAPLWNAQVQPQDSVSPSLEVLADEERAYLVSTFRNAGNDSNMGIEPASLEVRKAMDGTVVWHYPYQSKQYTTFTLSNGMVYVRSNPNGPVGAGGSICVMQASTGSQHWCLQTGTLVEHLTVGA